MQVKTLLFVVAVIALVACAPLATSQESQGFNRIAVPAQPHTVIVTVKNGRVGVAEEPIYIFEKLEKVVIIWQIDAQSRYKFDPTEGIKITGGAPKGLACGYLLNIDWLYGCVYDLPPTGTTYKYSVQVTDRSNPPRMLPKLDPTIVNDY